MSRKDKGRKWDGKSRISNDLYRKNFDEIFGKISREKSPPKEWMKGYRKWKKDNEDK